MRVPYANTLHDQGFGPLVVLIGFGLLDLILWYFGPLRLMRRGDGLPCLIVGAAWGRWRSELV